ncbi:Serine/threonine-protein kinase PknD [subsurface metagenome]
MAEENHCPQCGAELPADVPQGMCPKCLMKLGLPTGAEADKAGASDPTSDVPTSATPPGSFSPPEPAELARQFPQLEILELLGQGGMGVVYKARQKQLDRLVALKILPPQVAQTEAFAERFTREARSLARLNHPHIVMVHDFGHTEDGLYYFIMEFIDGTDLRHVIQAGELSAAESLAIVPQICEALQFAHEEGIVHRDIKPENILLDKKGRVKIADFGLAKLLDRPATVYTLTQAGQRMGTPHYMAPEQIEHPGQVDHRADIFSLGVVFYEMLTGELPLGRFPLPSRKVHVDVRLDEVVLKTLEKEPERRYQHASEVKTDVEAIAEGAAPPQPSGRTDTVEDESLEQFILSQLPATKIEAVKAYQEKTGAGRVEAVLAVDAITRKYGIEFVRVPLKHRLPSMLISVTTLVVLFVLYILFKRHVELSPIITWTVIVIFGGGIFIFFSVAAWRHRVIDKGLQFKFFAGFLLFFFMATPLLWFLAEPKPILERLYNRTGATPGRHDVLFFRIVLIAIVLGFLFWLFRLLIRLRKIQRIRYTAEVKTGVEAISSGRKPAPLVAVTGTKGGRGKLVLAGILIAVTFLFAWILVLVMVFGWPVIVRRTSTRQDPPFVETYTVAEQAGQLDLPYGTPEDLTFEPEGPTLSDQCIQTLELGPSEVVEVNEILRRAYRQYLELERQNTQQYRAANSLTVIISPFREEAESFLKQLWADLDGVLDEQKRALARRHLPLGQMFGTFQFGGPTVTISVSKENGRFSYYTTYKWPKGSGKSGRKGTSSGGGSTLPPEYRRFWKEPATDK